MSTKHPLGNGNGKMTDYGDGTAAYSELGRIKKAFRVRISDVSGFSVTSSSQAFHKVIHVFGHGSEIASADVMRDAPPLIEQWFRAHPQFQNH